ncbi:inositol 2-dehydrogenase-like isoform X1 [Lytechinus variegatus]|uniref:inositol 2-dehydrogenase-like isoform X1 n=1 Tax=Lytechinus variegatus TaxID=7654 RepID=UPI001BB209CC|nr:inositol 2-dehydrogenase-like isoform X1 [Lytechinus variegatus]
MVGVAVFGLGRIGRIHTKNLVVNRSVEIRWIVEEFHEDAKEFMAGTLRLDKTKLIQFKNASQVWNDEETQAVIVCTPTCTHQTVIMDALSAGKAVFCEKPLAPDLTSVRDCYEKAEDCGRPLFCGFNRRFDPSKRSLRDRIQGGEIGQVHRIKIVSRDPKAPTLKYLKDSGDIFHDCVVHEIDLVCWLTNEFPETVFAQGHAFDPRIAEVGDLDETLVSLKFPSGILATIDTGREASFGYDQRLEVHGSKGMLQIGNMRPTEVTVHKSDGATLDPVQYFFAERYAESYQLEMTHFIDIVKGEVNSMEVTMEDTIRATRLCDICSESFRKNQAITCVSVE